MAAWTEGLDCPAGTPLVSRISLFPWPADWLQLPNPAHPPRRASKAGLQFPVGRIARYLRKGRYAEVPGAPGTAGRPFPPANQPPLFRISSWLCPALLAAWPKMLTRSHPLPAALPLAATAHWRRRPRVPGRRAGVLGGGGAGAGGQRRPRQQEDAHHPPPHPAGGEALLLRRCSSWQPVQLQAVRAGAEQAGAVER